LSASVCAGCVESQHLANGLVVVIRSGDIAMRPHEKVAIPDLDEREMAFGVAVALGDAVQNRVVSFVACWSWAS